MSFPFTNETAQNLWPFSYHACILFQSRCSLQKFAVGSQLWREQASPSLDRHLDSFFDKQNTAAGSPTSDLARPFQFHTQLATCGILPPAKLTKIFTAPLKGHSVRVQARTRNNNANPTSAPERHGHFQLLKLHIIFQFAPAQNTFEVFAGFSQFMASRAISFGFNKQHTTSTLISTPTAVTLFLQSCTA